MLTEILMESLMSMDDETLDYVLESCSEEELEIINGTMEAVDMTASDRDDVQFISSIQQKARRSGWGNVPREDRDKFVKIMSTSKNINVLKKAAKLGEKEAAHDDKVLRALKVLPFGTTVGGGIGGAIFGNKYDKAYNADINRRFDDAYNQIKAGEINAVNDLSKNRISAFVNKGTIDGIKQGSADAIAELEKYRSDALLSPDQIAEDTMLGGGVGAIGGAALGASVSAIAKGIHRAKLNNRDKRQLAMQGEMKTPTERWKANRRADAIKAMKAKLNK